MSVITSLPITDPVQAAYVRYVALDRKADTVLSYIGNSDNNDLFEDAQREAARAYDEWQALKAEVENNGQ